MPDYGALGDADEPYDVPEVDPKDEERELPFCACDEPAADHQVTA